jgi:hypothetical protein
MQFCAGDGEAAEGQMGGDTGAHGRRAEFA